MTPELSAADRIEELEARLVEQERKLLEQEHRLWPAIRNLLDTREARADGPDALERYRAARLALVRRLIFRPGAVAIAVGGTGLAGILVALWTASLFQQQNQLFQEQNDLFRSQNEALLEQFEDENEDRTIARRAALLDVIYGCTPNSSHLGPDCMPQANSRAQAAAVEAYVAIEREAGARWVDLQRAPLPGVKLSNLDLSKVNFRGANLSNAILEYLDLRKSILHLANLGGTSLVLVNLSEAHLWQANMEDVTFTDVLLFGASMGDNYVPSSQWEGAWGDDTTVLLDSERPKHWGLRTRESAEDEWREFLSGARRPLPARR